MVSSSLFAVKVRVFKSCILDTVNQGHLYICGLDARVHFQSLLFFSTRVCRVIVWWVNGCQPQHLCLCGFAGVCSGVFCGCSSSGSKDRCMDEHCCETTCASSDQTSCADIFHTRDNRKVSLLQRQKQFDTKMATIHMITHMQQSITCVYPAVFSQVTGNGEGFPTVHTHIWPLSSMRPHVFLQVTTWGPTLAAHRAHVRSLPSVPPHMHVETSKCSEVFWTVGAAIGALTRVSPKVTLKPIPGLKTFPTLWTQEAALGAVTGTMWLEPC